VVGRDVGRVRAFSRSAWFVYNWKAGGALYGAFKARHWFPFDVPARWSGVGAAFTRPSNVLGTLACPPDRPASTTRWPTSVCIVIFGAKRIERRKTPYVTRQTLS
jgi:hypothetical protein